MTVRTFKQAVHPNDQSLQPRKFARPCVRHVATFRKFRAGSQKTGRPKERLPERDIARATIRISTISLREPWNPNAANLHIDRSGLNCDFISETARLKPRRCCGSRRAAPYVAEPSCATSRRPPLLATVANWRERRSRRRARLQSYCSAVRAREGDLRMRRGDA